LCNDSDGSHGDDGDDGDVSHGGGRGDARAYDAGVAMLKHMVLGVAMPPNSSYGAPHPQ
jgi:hypothetical protein